MVKFTFFDPDEKKPQMVHHEERPKPSKQETSPVARPREGGLILNWPLEFGWNKNPFSQLVPSPAHAFIVGQEHARQNLNLFFVKENIFGTISGPSGSGKSFMLHWLSEELAHHGRKPILIDASVSEKHFQKALTRPYETVLRKYKGSTPEELAAFLAHKNGIVVLIDNADDAEHLAPYCIALTRVAIPIIVAGVKPRPFVADDLRISLRPITSSEAFALIEKRIKAVGGQQPFTSRLVDELWKASKHNLSHFLDFCNESAMKIALKQMAPPQEHEAELEKNSSAPKETKTKKSSKSEKKGAYDDLIEGLLP